MGVGGGNHGGAEFVDYAVDILDSRFGQATKLLMLSDDRRPIGVSFVAYSVIKLWPLSLMSLFPRIKEVIITKCLEFIVSFSTTA